MGARKPQNAEISPTAVGQGEKALPGIHPMNFD